MSNRVEELESRVAELQAAVDGLTEELVETRERLRALEDDAPDARAERGTDGGTEGRTIDAEDGNAEVESTSESESASESEDADAAEPDSESAEDSTDSDDIIVA